MPYWAVRGVVGGLARTLPDRAIAWPESLVLGAVRGRAFGRRWRVRFGPPARSSAPPLHHTYALRALIINSAVTLTQPNQHIAKKSPVAELLQNFRNHSTENGRGSPNAHHTHTAPHHTAPLSYGASLPHSCPHPHPHLHHDHPPTPPPTTDNHHVFLSQ